MSNDLAIIERELTSRSSQLAEACRDIMPAERLIRTVLISAERTPAILNCSQGSIMQAAMTAAVLGLEVDQVTGQGFLIPFAGKAQFVIGYKGFSTLAARAGMTITGEVVRQGDEFDYDLGEGWVRHKPSLEPWENRDDRRIIAAWAKASAADRPPIVTMLSISDIMAIKAKSPGAKRSDSPWNNPTVGFPAMASKSAKRRLSRSTPLTVHYGLAAALDEATEERGKHAYITPDRDLMIEGEAMTPAEPSGTPEATDVLTKQSPAEILDGLEATARDKGVEELGREWTALHKNIQDALGDEEKRRLYQIAKERDA